MKVLAWLLGTATGRGVLIGGSITLGLALGWWFFSGHYYDKGKTDCDLARVSDANAANVAQGEQNAANNQTASAIGQETAKAGDAVIDQVNNTVETGKEKIRVVYRDPPVTAPVAPGSCVHPVDDRVQDQFEQARASAVEARARRGSL